MKPEMRGCALPVSTLHLLASGFVSQPQSLSENYAGCCGEGFWPRTKDPPPGGFAGRRPPGFVDPQSKTHPGVFSGARAEALAPRQPAVSPHTAPRAMVRQALNQRIHNENSYSFPKPVARSPELQAHSRQSPRARNHLPPGIAPRSKDNAGQRIRGSAKCGQ